MAAFWDPSTVHGALKPEFLTPIADLIWRVQVKVARHMQPHEGDDSWVAGCTGYRRRCVALEKLASGPAKDWLWAGLVENQFTICIHGFPVRIYRTPEEGDVPRKYADPSQMELEILGAALSVPADKTAGVLYRIEVTVGRYGKPLSINLVELDKQGRVTNSYAIPRSAKPATGEVSPIRRRKAPIVPPATNVESNVPKTDTTKKEEGTA